MVTCVWEKTWSPVYGRRHGHLCMGEDVVTCVWGETWSPVYEGRHGHLCMGEDIVTCAWEKRTLI
jgi:hypothetical protein